MTFLCIDWGNTLVKAAVMAEPDSFIAQETFTAADALDKITVLLDTHSPKASILSSVADHDLMIDALLTERKELVVVVTPLARSRRR